MKYFKVGTPIFVVILTVMNLLFAYYADNSAALWANVTALFGWLALSVDAVSEYNRAVKYDL